MPAAQALCKTCSRQAKEGKKYCSSCLRFGLDRRDKNGIATFLPSSEKERILWWRVIEEEGRKQEAAFRAALGR